MQDNGSQHVQRISLSEFSDMIESGEIIQSLESAGMMLNMVVFEDREVILVSSVTDDVLMIG